MKNNEIPKSVLEFGFDFDWDEEAVWKLNYPEEDLDIDKLVWHFEIPFWDWNGEHYNLTPNQVLNDTEKYQEQYARIMNSDISYPIDVMENKGRLVILDGLHRLAKCKILRMNKVKARIIPRSEIKNISKQSIRNIQIIRKDLFIKDLGTKTLETERLILRKFTLDDSEAVFNNWGSVINVTKYVSFTPHKKVEETKEIISMWISEYADDNFNWIVELKETHEVIAVLVSMEKVKNIIIVKLVMFMAQNFGVMVMQLKLFAKFQNIFQLIAIFIQLKPDIMNQIPLVEKSWKKSV